MKILAACVIPGILGALFAAALFAPPTPTWFQPGDNMIVVDSNGVKRIMPNTANMLSRSGDVSNGDHFCDDTQGTTAYRCAPAPAAWAPGSGGYLAGQWVMLRPSSSSFGSASLDVNSKGPNNVKLSDGTTDPGSRLVAGSIYLLVHDGTVWRMSQGDSK